MNNTLLKKNCILRFWELLTGLEAINKQDALKHFQSPVYHPFSLLIVVPLFAVGFEISGPESRL